jgi:hypothetical protein
MTTSADQAGVVLTCSDHECGCRHSIFVPCPRDDRYTCECGLPLEPVGTDR